MTMLGGLLKSASAVAIVAAAGLFSYTPANAADLGGDCCADLEERVAELEATTVRKGNRKLSMTISGRVDAALLWFDNGYDQDVYVVDRGSRFAIEGSGALRPGVTAGYQLRIKTRSNFSDDVTEDDGFDNTGGTEEPAEVTVDKANWWIEHENLGRLTVGNTSGTMDELWVADIAGGTFYAEPGLPAASLGIYTTAGAFSGEKTGDVFGQNYGNAGSMVRWDSPLLGGAFKLSASWGQDDTWAAGLAYAQEFNGLRVAAVASYEVDDNDGNDGAGNAKHKYLVSGAVHHVPSGIYVQGYYDHSEREDDAIDDNTGTSWFVQAGVSKDFSGMGATNIYLQYADVEEFVAGSSGQMWGLGLDQNLDAIGAVWYTNYRNHQRDSEGATDFDDVSTLISGMRFNF